MQKFEDRSVNSCQDAAQGPARGHRRGGRGLRPILATLPTAQRGAYPDGRGARAPPAPPRSPSRRARQRRFAAPQEPTASCHQQEGRGPGIPRYRPFSRSPVSIPVPGVTPRATTAPSTPRHALRTVLGLLHRNVRLYAPIQLCAPLLRPPTSGLIFEMSVLHVYRSPHYAAIATARTRSRANSRSTAALPSINIAARARAFTVSVECRR